jgi:murein DD-endopeptidase MepM/ murein hydrolase activator NlpD
MVSRVEFNSGGYGRQIIIDHGFDITTRYAHLQSFSVLEGSVVKRGQIIGKVGSTGLSAGPHLHYEVLKNGRPVNPINFFNKDLSPEEYLHLNEQSQKNDILEIW